MSSAAGPLAGLTIVAVEQFGAGPFGTVQLADLGATVIKIEDPRAGGDIGRYVPPGQSGTDSLFFETFNRSKRSIALDLQVPADRQTFERLVATSDAVFSNLRGDLPERLGLTFDALEALNPRIVCVALTGYGRTGKRAAWPGYDALVQAEAGWAALTGRPEDPPTKSGLSLADYVAGLHAAIGLLAGVMSARATGKGCDVDVNLYDSALAMLSYPATWLLSAGIPTERQPLSAHPSIVPFQFFRTADGYVAVACAKQHFFEAFMRGIGLGHLLTDDRFTDFASRRLNRDSLTAHIQERLADRSTAELLETLQGSVPIAPVRSLADALDPVELAERGMLAAYEHPRLGPVRAVGSAIHIAGWEPRYRSAPALGGDGPTIMAELGERAHEGATPDSIGGGQRGTSEGSR
jgi:crotonobetainyl-CoA:carnitine CoA-transferase CaiB-like acyl-CoA transferase